LALPAIYIYIEYLKMTTPSSVTKAAVFRAIAHARKSAKRFEANRVIPRDILKDMLQSTIRSPSGFNLQPTQIIMVHSAALKQEVSQHAMLGVGNQYRTVDASALAVFLSDLQAGKRIDRIHQLEHASQMRHPNYLGSMPLASSFLLGQGHAATLLKRAATDVLSELQPMPVMEPIHAWAYKNTALALQSYVLAATSHDLATCIMEGFDARRLSEILRIPDDRYAICACVATGYEYPEEKQQPSTPRLAMEEVVFGETFGEPWVFEEEEDEAEATRSA